jgi:hypothetical protein
MFYTYFSTKEDPLMTLGDAIASFLSKPDVATRDVGLLTIRNCGKRYKPGASSWRDLHWRWKDATSLSRRVVVLLL